MADVVLAMRTGQAPVMRGLCIATGVVSLLSSIFLSLSLATTFIPSNTLLANSYMWNVVTYAVAEPNLLLASINIGVMWLLGSTLEQSTQSPVRLMKVLFLAVICTSLFILVSSAILSQVGFTWIVQSYSGPWVIVSALTVMHFQLTPLSEALAGFTAGSFHGDGVLPWLRRQHLPLGWFLVAFIVDLFRDRPQQLSEYHFGSDVRFPGSAALLVAVSSWFTWFYLRYIQGDAATSFAYNRMFFPAPVRAGVLYISSLLFPCVVFCGLGKEVASASVLAEQDAAARRLESGESNAIPAVVAMASQHKRPLLPGSTEADAERRRAIALAALSSRLLQTQSPAPQPQPTPATTGSLAASGAAASSPTASNQS